MKSINILIITTIISFLLFGCNTDQKFVINSQPGTEIYTPNMKFLGKTNSTTGKFELSSNAYYAYLLAKTPDNPSYIPFALDYTKDNPNGKSSGFVLGGLGGMGAGLGVGLAGSQIAGVALIGAGFAVMMCGIPTMIKSQEYAGLHQFKYCDMQYTNNNFHFTMPEVNEPMRVIEEVRPQENIIEVSNSQQLSLGNLQKAKGKKTDNPIEGAYKGEAKLLNDDGIASKWDDLSIEINQIDSKTAKVKVLVFGNEPFFESESEIYDIKDNNNGTYTLTLKKQPTVSITIKPKDKTFSYTNPSVEIDGKTYYLVIKANKLR